MYTIASNKVSSALRSDASNAFHLLLLCDNTSEQLPYERDWETGEREREREREITKNTKTHRESKSTLPYEESVLSNI